MMWIKEGFRVWRNQLGHPCSPLHAQGLPRKIRVKLTIAHADNNPWNMDDANLRCWCTWCHLHHDQPHHKETRCRRKDAQRPILRDPGHGDFRGTAGRGSQIGDSQEF
jgi:hypothetical protein